MRSYFYFFLQDLNNWLKCKSLVKGRQLGRALLQFVGRAKCRGHQKQVIPPDEQCSAQLCAVWHEVKNIQCPTSVWHTSGTHWNPSPRGGCGGGGGGSINHARAAWPKGSPSPGTAVWLSQDCECHS